MQKAMSFNNIAIVYVKGNAYRLNFWYMMQLMVLFYLIKGMLYKIFLL